MIAISNSWKHPRTSLAGVLISVATVAGVLSQHGVTLGTLGSGTVVSLAGALAAALLGLVARDPATPQQAPSTGDGNFSTTAKLGAWVLIALLLPLPWLEGCTGASVAQDIVNWTPTLQSAVATVDSTAALLAPADAPAFAAATAGFDAASNLLSAQAKAYLANPSAGVLDQLQSQVVTFQQQVDSALLAAARIVDTPSQQHAMAVLQSVATIVTAILSLVQSVSSKSDVARMASQSPIKMASVRPWLCTARSAQIVAAHYRETLAQAQQQMAQAEQNQLNAGL